MGKKMSLVLGTNIWSHHQTPLAQQFISMLGENHFRSAVFENVDDERRSMGWASEHDVPWLIGPPHNETEKNNILRSCIDADVMIIGDCPREIMRARIATGKLTFIAAERILKKPFHKLRMLNPRYALGINEYCEMINRSNVHALTIGHYAPYDLQKIGAFENRIWEWGYFTDVSATPPVELPNRSLKILWCGRLLQLKRVDTILKAISKIRDSASIDECLIVGDGPAKESLIHLSNRLHLPQALIKFIPSVSFSQVRSLMRDSDVFIFPSNRYEGWGAVAGEAMSEGSVLVANEQAGAARKLIVDGVTGFIFKDGDANQLASYLNILSHDYKRRMMMRQLAWERMNTIWSPKVAAERLLSLIHGLLLGKPPFFAEGPCSKAIHHRLIEGEGYRV